MLADLKRALEDTNMDRPEFVYTTYIRTTPEQLWQALTEPAFTRRYWQLSFETDWKAGSTMTLVQDGLTVTDPEQVVLEADPYRRLAYTWHTFTPEWAAHFDVSDQDLAAFSREPRSRVAFDLEPKGPLVKLTVVHDGFGPGSMVITNVSQGWPRVCSRRSRRCWRRARTYRPSTPRWSSRRASGQD